MPFNKIFGTIDSMNLQKMGIALMPLLFVLLWSTGFIGAKFGLPYAEPFTFLTIRFALTLLLVVPLVWMLGVRWPPRALWGHTAVTGILIHAAYLGGVFNAIEHGMPAGLAALVVGIQPVLTAALAGPWLGEKLNGIQWTGVAAGLGGVCLVLGSKLELDVTLFEGFGVIAIVSILLALAGMTLGTLYQKRFCAEVPLLSGAVIQFSAAAGALGMGAWLLETGEVTWNLTFVMALGWLVLVLSIAAILLLMALIRQGEASHVASLFYLVPPVTALQAWWLFDERLSWPALLGMAVTVAGVFAVVQGRTRP